MNTYQQLLSTVPADKQRFTNQHFNSPAEILHRQDCHFSDCAFSNMTLDHADWSGLIFERCEINSLHFQAASLRDCHFIDCCITNCQFSDSTCQEWNSQHTRWQRCSWQQSRSEMMSFQQGEWQEIGLQQCDSRHWNLIELQVEQFDLQGGSASDWNLCKCQLTRSRWCEVTLQRQVAAECQLVAVQLINIAGETPVWFACAWAQSDLSELTLTGGSFHRNHFSHCNFSQSQLTGTILAEAQLTHCNLQKVNSSRVQAQKTAFHQCSLSGSVWTNDHLPQAVFEQCEGNDAQFIACDLRGAQLAGLPATARLIQSQLHSAAGLPEDVSVSRDPLLDAITAWYHDVQPGPERLRHLLKATGASRYV